MTGYGRFQYDFADSHRGDWPGLALASQKNYVLLYVCAARKGKYIAELHKRNFPKVDIGKSCIRLKKLDDISLKKLAAVLTRSGSASWLGQKQIIGLSPRNPRT